MSEAPPPQSAPGLPAAFSPRTVLILLLVGLTAFVSLGVLTAYAPALRARSQGGENALSRSAVGYAGLVRLLEAEGVPVVVSRGQLPPLHGAGGVVIFTPPADTTAAKLTAALRAGRRRTLVILPKWVYTPDPDHLGWARRVGLVPALLAVATVQPRGVTGLNRRDAPAGARTPAIRGDVVRVGGLRTGRLQSLQTLVAPGARTLLSDDAGQPVLVQLAQGAFVLSDPDLVDNQGLASLEGARTALAVIDMVRGGQGPVVFDVTLNGFARARSLLGLALAPPFLGASLCALAAAVLMGWHAAARFGPARPQARALALGKTALLDNTAMLISLARREPKMGRRYAVLVRRVLARRVLSRAAADPGEGRLDGALDRLTPAGEPPFSTLAVEAGDARDAPAMLRAARRLHQRQMEILGERH